MITGRKKRMRARKKRFRDRKLKGWYQREDSYDRTSSPTAQYVLSLSWTRTPLLPFDLSVHRSLFTMASLWAKTLSLLDSFSLEFEPFQKSKLPNGYKFTQEPYPPPPTKAGGCSRVFSRDGFRIPYAMLAFSPICYKGYKKPP